jgi:hypothetical protein
MQISSVINEVHNGSGINTKQCQTLYRESIKVHDKVGQLVNDLNAMLKHVASGISIDTDTMGDMDLDIEVIMAMLKGMRKEVESFM